MIKQTSTENQNSSFGFFHLLKGESNENLRTILIYALISGISNAILLSVVNSSIKMVAKGKIDYYGVILFLLSFALFYITKKYILVKTTLIVENTISRIRTRIVSNLRKCDLDLFEKVGESVIYARLSNDVNLISNGSSVIIGAIQSVIMVLCVLGYMSAISLLGFLITCATIAGGVFVFLSKQKALSKEIQKTTEKEKEFFSLIQGIFSGFKELKLSKTKNDDVFEATTEVIDSSRDIKVHLGTSFAGMHIFSETLFYLLLAAIVFILPIYGQAYIENIIAITNAILFVIGPLGSIVSSVQLFLRANVAINNIYQLESSIQATNKEDSPETGLPEPDDYSDFGSIELVNATYAYQGSHGDPGFSVGKFNLTINQGETIVIAGGNGSGKTTLMKLLSGLYLPKTGKIRIQGKRTINKKNIHSYRELFSAIFTDFHLFDRLYGILENDENLDKLDDLLHQMNLDEKTRYLDGQFTSLNLSTGQKKRLGLAISILEDKPILIFDEVTADQDPEFRKYFYSTLLKELKQQGKTIILVSHDDRYFYVGDRFLKLDFGKVVEENAVVRT